MNSQAKRTIWILAIAMVTTFLIAQKAHAGITFVGAGTASGVPNGNMSPGVPSGIQNNDILIVVVHQRTNTESSTMPGDWNLKFTGTGSGSALRVTVWWKRTTGSQTAPTVTYPGSAAAIAQMYAFRGVVTSGDPFNMVGTVQYQSGSATISTAAITTSADGAMILHTMGCQSGHGWGSYTGIPTNEAGMYINNQTGGNDNAMAVSYGLQTLAGSTGAAGATHGGGDASISVQMALAPEPGTILGCGQCPFNYFAAPIDVTPGSTGSWVDVNVSSYVPSGATGVIIQALNPNTTSSKTYGARMNGSTDTWMISYQAIPANGMVFLMSGLDASRIFEVYNATEVTTYLIGYTMAGVTLFQNAPDKTSLLTAGSWSSVDITADTADGKGAIGAIFTVHNTNSNGQEYALRKNGSTDDANIYKQIRSATATVHMIGVDSGDVAQGKFILPGAGGVTLHLTGYIREGAYFFTNVHDKSTGTLGSYVDVDITGDLQAGDKANGVLLDAVDGASGGYAFRRNGTSYDYYREARQVGAVTAVDGTQIFEQKIALATRKLYLNGYTLACTGQFGYRRQITIKDSMTPTGCGANLANFPVLISLSNQAWLKTRANGGNVSSFSGYDIIFRASDGVTQLDHEVEQYDGVNGTLVAWVRIPTLIYNAAMTIYMYYGNGAITGPTQNPTAVWDSNYKGVWHLSESGNGTAGEFKDSTSNSFHGQGGGGTSSKVPAKTTAQIGNGQNFDGSDDSIKLPNNMSIVQNVAGATLSVWLKGDTLSGQQIVSLSTSTAGTNSRAYLGINGSGPQAQVGGRAPDSGTNNNITGATLSTATWYYVVGVIDYAGDTLTLYLNGAQDATGSYTFTNAATDNTLSAVACLGAQDDCLSGFHDGLLDEIRVSNTVRSACWIGTEYNNQSAPATHITVGGTEEIQPPKFAYQREMTIKDLMTPASCTSSLRDFPILVNLSGSWLRTRANDPTNGRIETANGWDIVFRASDGITQLDHEIEKYDGSAGGGSLVAWVRIPSLTYNGDTTIYMDYGNAAITSPTANPTGVWDANFLAVHHLEENPTGTVTDSTINANNMTGTNMDAADAVNGKIGQGFNFDYSGGVSEYLTSTNNITIQAFTFDLWANPETHSAWEVLMNFDSTGGSNYRYFAISDTNTLGYDGEGGLSYLGGVVTEGEWQHFVLTYDGSTMRAYRNGSQVGSVSKTILSRTYNFEVASFRNGSERFDGQMDEARVSSVARSDCWIGTEYNSVQYAGDNNYFQLSGEFSNLPAAPTAVKLTSFTATQYSDGVLVKWKTGYEVDNLGFHLYREENGQLVRLTPEPVAGSALLAGSRLTLRAGHHYHWWDLSTLDTRSSTLGSLRYWLKDIDLSGKETMHGSVTPVFSREPIPDKQRPELLSERGWRLQERYHHYWKIQELKGKLGNKRSAMGHQLSAVRRASNLKAEGQSSNLQRLWLAPRGNSVPDPQTQWYLASRPAIKLLVKEDGWYRVTQPELIAAGLNPKANSRNLQLFAEGREQPIHVIGGKDGGFGSRDAIEFYGVGLDTPSTDTRVYWLVEGFKPGKRIHEVRGYSGSLGSLSSSSFPYTVEVKDRWIYLPAIKNGEEENFFGAVVYGSGVDQLLEVKHLDLASSEDAFLEVELQGATNTSHRVKVLLNKEEVGEVVFEGQSKGFFQAEVPQSLLLEGDNLVSFIPLGGEMDVSLVDSIRLTYWHSYAADDNGLRFTAQGGEQRSIGGFGSSGIRVFDITEPTEVIEVFGKVESQGGGYAVSFRVPETGQRTLLALAEERVKAPEGILSNQPSSWHQVREGYDLIIISHRDFFESLEPLKKLRESQGLRVALVDIEDLYDEFSFGNKSPKAIKDFLGSAKAKWSKPPRFVLLVGDASFDPRNYLGMGDLDFVPTKLVDTQYLETSSDDWFVDLNGDGLPEMAVGRIPVQTVEETAIVVSKIVGYEKSTKTNEALLVADRVDNSDDFNFEGASEEIWGLLPSSLTVRKIYRGQFSSDSQVNGVLLSAINQGPLLVNFIGHGSIEIWRGNIFTSDDAEGLINGMRLPFFVNMTCLNGYFQDPYSETLGEALLKAKGGGAIAVWTSSGLTEPDKQAVMNKELIQLLFNGQSFTLGEATAKAKKVVSDQDVRRTWILFGDPTTRLK